MLNQIYKDGSDDRLCKIAVPTLQNIDSFLKSSSEQAASDNKLTQLVVYVFQSLQWAVDCDPDMVRASLSSIDFTAFVESLMTLQFNRVASPLKSLDTLTAEGLTDKENLTFVKQRRLIAKMLVILFRDFNKLAVSDKNRLQTLLKVSWGLCLNSLVYLQPFYQERVLFAAEEQRQ